MTTGSSSRTRASLPLLMGEWGGFMDGDKNEQWMTYLRDFMIENRIHHTFWCFNENSGDTGGLVYDNFGKWDEDKYALVKPALWQDDNGKFISLDHTIALGSNGISLSDYYGGGNNNTTEPDSKIIAGDVNSDKLVNGVDLTLMRQNITKWQSTDDVLTASPTGHQRQRRIQHSRYCPADAVSAGKRRDTEKLFFLSL